MTTFEPSPMTPIAMLAESEMKSTHQDADPKSCHVTPADGNVFADLGFSPKEAKALLKNADARIAKAQRLKEEAATAIAQ